jgi:hypothetical protein
MRSASFTAVATDKLCPLHGTILNVGDISATNLVVSSDLTVRGTFSTSGPYSPTGKFIITDATAASETDGALVVTGGVLVKESVIVDTDLTVNGSLITAGPYAPTGKVTITDATPATDTDGALVVTGGILAVGQMRVLNGIIFNDFDMHMPLNYFFSSNQVVTFFNATRTEEVLTTTLYFTRIGNFRHITKVGKIHFTLSSPSFIRATIPEFAQTDAITPIYVYDGETGQDMLCPLVIQGSEIILYRTPSNPNFAATYTHVIGTTAIDGNCCFSISYGS